jgi:hypothetical protein
VALSHRQTLPALAACYFVVGHDGAVLYIGRTGNLQKRFLAHHRQWDFEQEPPPVRIAWLLMTDHALLAQIERLCIDFWTPKYNHGMARPKLGKEPYVYLGLRLDPQVLPALDAYVADVQRQMGPWEVRIDRGKALRHLVVSGLRTLGYLPDAAGTGPVLATADQTADLSPSIADQSAPKAAQRQDQQRTTSRKRTAAKG